MLNIFCVLNLDCEPAAQLFLHLLLAEWCSRSLAPKEVELFCTCARHITQGRLDDIDHRHRVPGFIS